MKQIIEGINKELRKEFKEHVEGISNKFKVSFKECNAFVNYSEDYIVTDDSLKQKGIDIRALKNYLNEFRKLQFEH